MIIFCGDIHGNFREFVYLLKRCDITDAHIIILGDFGIGFHKKNYYINEFEHLNKQLKTRNIKVYALRGNHDDPSYFEEYTEYGNFILLPDYHILEIEDKRILILGGAISIDREDHITGKHRIEGIDYWKNENFVFKEHKIKDIKVDIVASHSSPKECFPQTSNGYTERAKFDKNLQKDIEDERSGLSKVYEIIKKNNAITHWFYGHYHENNKEKINDTEFICLNKMTLSDAF